MDMFLKFFNILRFHAQSTLHSYFQTYDICEYLSSLYMCIQEYLCIYKFQEMFTKWSYIMHVYIHLHVDTQLYVVGCVHVCACVFRLDKNCSIILSNSHPPPLKRSFSLA